MALMRVYCGLAATDPTGGPDPINAWLTAAVVDDAGRLLDICDISDDAVGYAELGALLAGRSSGTGAVAVAADSDEHQVTLLLAAAGSPLAIVDDDMLGDYADRFADDESPDEIEAGPAERNAVGLARALQAGALAADGQGAPRELMALKPVLAAHASLATGRHSTAVALREVLRELYPAALRAYPDPAEPTPLAILDALPEPGLLGTAAANRGRDAMVVAELAAAGVADADTITEAITALRVAIAETPRRTGIGKGTTTAVAETIRQAVAAVRACDAAVAALVGLLADKAAPATRPALAPLRAVGPSRQVSAQPSTEPARKPVRRGRAAVAATAGNVVEIPMPPATRPAARGTSRPASGRPSTRAAAGLSAPTSPAPMPTNGVPVQSTYPGIVPSYPTQPAVSQPGYPMPGQPGYWDPGTFIPPAADPYGAGYPDTGYPDMGYSSPGYAEGGYQAEPSYSTESYHGYDSSGYPLAPGIPAPGTRQSWPLSTPDWDDAARVPVDTAVPHQRDGRVAPPWQTDDLPLPVEPPMLRLVDTDPVPSSVPLRLISDNGAGQPLRSDTPRTGTGRRTDLSALHLAGGPRGGDSLTALSAPISPAPAGDELDGDLLIFAEMKSAWFVGPQDEQDAPPAWSDAADLGWSAAERAAHPMFSEETEVGLPKRIPQANLVPGSPLPPMAEHGLHIVRDPASMAAHTTGYFRGSRRGEEVRGYAVGGRPGRESGGGWDFSRDSWEAERDTAFHSAARR